MYVLIYLLREHRHKHLHHDVHVEVRGQLGVSVLSSTCGPGTGLKWPEAPRPSEPPHWLITHREHPETFGNAHRHFSLPLFLLSNCTLFDFLGHWSHGVCYFSSVARARLYVKSVTLDIPFLLGYIKWFDFPTIFRAWLKSKH